MQRRSYTAKRFLLLSGALLAATAARAQTFSAPAPLSYNGYAGNGSLGVDASGKATAFWTDLGIYTSEHPKGGVWSRPAALPVGVLPGGAPVPVLRVDDAGRASLLSWTSGSGIWVADRVTTGPWGNAVQLASAPSLVSSAETGVPMVQFLSNRHGDQAIVYADYVAPTYRLMAVRRPATAAMWGAPEIAVTPAQGGSLVAASAAIGPTGDVLAAWESYSVRCGTRSCSEYNFVVHAVRATSGSGVWEQSSDLTLPLGGPAWTLAAIDSAGGAAVLIEPSFGDTVTSVTQAHPGAAWSTPATVFGAPGTLVSLWGFSTGPHARASVILTSASASAAAIVAVDGNLAANSWSAGTNLAPADSNTGGVVVVGANAAGGSVVASTDTDGTEWAALRMSATVPWLPPQKLVGPGQCAVLNLNCTVSSAAAIDRRGHAVVLYNRSEPSDNIHTLYAVTE